MKLLGRRKRLEVDVTVQQLQEDSEAEVPKKDPGPPPDVVLLRRNLAQTGSALDRIEAALSSMRHQPKGGQAQ